MALVKVINDPEVPWGSKKSVVLNQGLTRHQTSEKKYHSKSQ